jgi:hypothetical protein
MAKKKSVDEEALDEMLQNAPTLLPNEIATSFDQLIKRELTKFDVVVPAVAELSKEFLPLKIASIDDVEGYSEVSKALRFIVSKRTAVEDKRKELKADSLAYGRAVDARAKEITEMLSPIEMHLKSEKDRIDEEKEAIKKREEEAKLNIINERANKLIRLGGVLLMTEYIWKSRINDTEISTPRINLELFTDEEFDEFVGLIVKEKELEDAQIKAEEERKLAEQAKLAEEQQKLQEERAKLQAEQDKIKKEMEEFKQQRASLRNSLLIEIGLGTMSFNPNWVFIPKTSIQNFINIISYDEVLNYSNDEWEAKYAEIKIRVSKIKADDEAELARREEFQKTEALRVLKEKSENESAAEKERIAGLSDKEKYEDYIDRLKEQPVPEMSTKKWTSYITSVTKSLNTFKNMG